MESIEGIENLPKVQKVLIYFNQIKSLKGIENCKYVTQLSADKNQLENLNWIQNLNLLTEINVEDNNITSIKEISGLPLVKLNVNNNKITSLEGIESVSTLEYLDAWNNQISSLYYLRNQKNLKFLNVDRNHLSDIRQLLFLRELPVLDKLWLSETGKTSEPPSNQLCVDSIYPNFVIQALSQIDAYEYEVMFDRGPEYYSNTFDNEFRAKALETILEIPKLTDELIEELKKQ
ncbi:guanylate_kinase [Hexamita inflata]|uniref:Variant n=1 Tax=Hexamita inflata TaxID=28002 RepID=A0AA86QAG7_9EUKA|nr:guanylate kinase [Hexamita inflata]CAI9952408.1 guanylate kinase [Hexamita inflata]CAI9952432.1 guanylate kinase [Hexamita inflata]CAI9963949.1 guanylate kinase [Hexamita inflata]